MSVRAASLCARTAIDSFPIHAELLDQAASLGMPPRAVPVRFARRGRSHIAEEEMPMMKRKIMLTACSVILGLYATLGASGGGWMEAHRTTFVTFSRPVSLPGVTLGNGTYVFELAAPETNLDVVRVFNMERTQVFYTGFTEHVRRPAGMPPDRLITLGEAAAGVPAPIDAWYPLGESAGHRFIYSTAR